MSRNVDPSPSRESTSTCPWWLAATWRTIDKPETGPSAVAAPALVDAVEALEDAVEVAGGDADALVLDVEAHLAVGDACRRSAPRSRRRRTSRRSRGGCRAPRRAGGGRRGPCTGGAGSSSSIFTSRWSAAARMRSTASAMIRLTSTGSRGGASSASMRDRSSRSSMIRLIRKASVWMRLARRWATVGSFSAARVSASSPMRAHGGLQLVAHVGDEVAADLLEAPALGHVVDGGDHPERAPAVVDQLRATRPGCGAAGRRGRASCAPSPVSRRRRAGRRRPGRPARRRGGRPSARRRGALRNTTVPFSSHTMTPWGSVSRARRSRMASDEDSATASAARSVTSSRWCSAGSIPMPWSSAGASTPSRDASADRRCSSDRRPERRPRIVATTIPMTATAPSPAKPAMTTFEDTLLVPSTAQA